MGACASTDEKLTPQEKEQRKQEIIRSQELDKKIQQDEQTERTVNKLLLLGAGESGKSTLFKQMIKIYGSGFSEAERKNTYVRVVHSNVIASIKALSQVVNSFGGIQTREADEAKRIVDDFKVDDDLTVEIGKYMAILWADPGIQAAYEKRNTFQLYDSAKYFLDKVEKIADPDYLPEEKDVFYSRVRTTGIVSTEFNVEGNKFHMFDVGGQRNERKKWIHCFENVTAVIFVAAMSEYDQMLYEDESVQRIAEALTLFDEVCNSRWFKKTSMILFLNKCDLFAEKIVKKPLRTIFPDYQGDDSYEQQAMYMRRLFESQNRSNDGRNPNSMKKIYTHITCAMDTNQIKVVFNAVKDIIIRGNLEAAGLM